MTHHTIEQRVPNLMLISIFTITLTTAIGTSSIPPALPIVAQKLSIPLDRIGLLMAIFTLPGILLTPLFGLWADAIGRKAILLPSLCIFGLGGILAWFAQSFEVLLAARFIQGVGAASLGALNVTLIGDFYHAENRVRLMGYNNTVLSIGTAFFPVLGGYLAGINWHLPFLLSVICFPIAILVWLRIPEHNMSKTKSQTATQAEFDFRKYLASLLRLLRLRRTIILLTISFITFTLLFGPFLTYLPFYAKQLLHPSQAQNTAFILGTLIMVMSLSTAVVALFLGYISKKIQLERLLILSCFFYAVSILTFGVIGYIGTTYSLDNMFGYLYIPCIVFGIAQALNQPNTQALLASDSSFKNRAGLMSLNRMFSLVGQTTGPIVFAVLLGSGTSGLLMVFIVGSIIAISLGSTLFFSTLLVRGNDNSNLV